MALLQRSLERLARPEADGFRRLHPNGFAGPRVARLACRPLTDHERTEAGQLNLLVFLERGADGAEQTVESFLGPLRVAAGGVLDQPDQVFSVARP